MQSDECPVSLAHRFPRETALVQIIDSVPSKMKVESVLGLSRFWDGTTFDAVRMFANQRLVSKNAIDKAIRS